MALPRDTDSYESYTDQLVYFRARLAANPDTASLSESVEQLLNRLDDAHKALRDARRAEVNARARRDHQDAIGDEKVRRFKRRIDVVGDDQLTQRLFPRGVTHTIAPRGRPQVERLTKLIQSIDELTESPRVAAHVDVEEIKQTLAQGHATLTEARDTLRQLVDDCDAEAAAVRRALEDLDYEREEGFRRLGAVMGELRAKLGGDNKAAYSYTQPARSNSATADDEEAAEPDETPTDP